MLAILSGYNVFSHNPLILYYLVLKKGWDGKNRVIELVPTRDSLEMTPQLEVCICGKMFGLGSQQCRIF